MPDVAIALRGVSKKYRLRRGWYVTSLRHEFDRLAAWLSGRGGVPREEFWALKDVTFEVKRGEILGLIGVNGAGKSTLLKILSRVTVPTRGTFATCGRVGALIEIGAGFHPELSGRENIYLNGSILGMRRREIQAKFDQIVSFAEIEQFVDTPIKHYSSGMQMRLGFAVAAHIDPEILLIDEILAVGDAAFQAKCLNKLAELKAQDKTIILVSHNLSNISDHSRAVLWLDRGTVRMIGDPEGVVNAYLQHVTGGGIGAEAAAAQASKGPRDKPVAIVGVTIRDDSERPRTQFDTGETVLIDITYRASVPVPGASFGMAIRDIHGYPLGGVFTDPDSIKVPVPVERGVLRLALRPLLLTKGAYTLNVSVGDRTLKRYYDVKQGAARIVVNGTQASNRVFSGYFQYPHEWESLK